MSVGGLDIATVKVCRERRHAYDEAVGMPEFHHGVCVNRIDAAKVNGRIFVRCVNIQNARNLSA